MPFEEDFLLVSTPKIGFLQECIDILDSSSHNLMGLLLRSDVPRQGEQLYMTLTTTKNKTYEIICQTRRVYQFNFGAAIYRIDNVQNIVSNGRKENYSTPMAESKIDASIALKLGMFYGVVDFNLNCSKKKR